MGETWVGVIDTTPPPWGIPLTTVADLKTDLTVAKDLLAIVNSGDRTKAKGLECDKAFDDLETEMRYIKKHHFLIPPLTKADFARLLLPIPSDTRTKIGRPDGQPALTLSYPGGPHKVTVHTGPLAGTEQLDPRSDYGYAIYMGMMPQGGATLEQAASAKHYLMKPPLSGDDLKYFKFTRQHKEEVVFPPEEAGMTAYFCARYENPKGDAGDWGPIVSTIAT
jgi:hypothetical protein